MNTVRGGLFGRARRAGRMDRRWGFATLVGAVVADQLSKSAALEWLRRGEVVEIAPFFNLRLAFNRGISCGILGDGAVGPVVLSAVTAVIIAALLVWMWRTTSVVEAAALGLVAGGAIGNLVDRLLQGAVTDFLDFYVADWHWPTFNLGDSAITVGVGLMLLAGLRTTRTKGAAK